eukprot:gb/GFBE01010941.1/.p1 GENE.gb/GFBE01010941.1/~~gb/GFBE01010941.1/.p1  ORF type:complete len:380 (+),score=68.71 gb/GFBE01010941.1/:1-1140(+)
MGDEEENDLQGMFGCCCALCAGGGGGACADCGGGNCFSTAADCMDAIAPFAEALGKVISCAASPCLWPIVYCFPADEDLGKPWAVQMEYAPCKQPFVFCCNCCCIQLTQAYVRYTVLDQDVSKYKCCQGIYDGPYCCAVCSPSLPFTFKAGTYGDEGNACCLVMEACCCPFCAFEASREYQRADRGLGYDPTETRVYKCLEFFGCCAECLLCCGCCVQVVGCCAGCLLGEAEFQESSERLGNACQHIAYGIIKGMRWILRIATACMSAQMTHEAGLPKDNSGIPGQMMGAPMQQEMGGGLKAGMQAAGGGGAPVPRDVAKRFLQALRDEYVSGKFGAVGDVIDNLPAHQNSALAPHEDSVRESQNPSAAIQSLAKSWGM